MTATPIAALIEALKCVVFQTDAEGHWIYLNPAWTEVTGFPTQDSLGAVFLDHVYPDDREKNLALFQPLISRQKDSCRHEIRYRHADGGYRWVEVFARLTLDDDDQIIGTTGTLTDITASRRQRSQLQQANTALTAIATIGRDFLSGTGDADFSHALGQIGQAFDLDRASLCRNHRRHDGALLISQHQGWEAQGFQAPPFLGLPYQQAGLGRWLQVFQRDELITSHVRDLPDSERRPLEAQGCRSVLACPVTVEGRWWGFIILHACRSERHWDSATTAALRAAAGLFGAAIERHDLARDVARQNQRFSTLLDWIELDIFVSDIHTHELLFLNRAMQERFGDVVGQPCWQALHLGLVGPCERCSKPHLLDAHGQPRPPQLQQHERSDGSWWELSNSAIPWPDGRMVHMQAAQNIDTRKRNQAVLLQATRMEASAALAAGIAHDFNNLLGTVLANAVLLHESDTLGGEQAEMLAEITDATRSASELSQKLLAFTQGGRYAPKPLALTEIVTSVLHLQQHMLPRRIQVLQDFAACNWRVQADRQQLGQMIQALLANAIEAIEGAGVIQLRAHELQLSEPTAQRPAGRYVCFSIQDDGEGMSATTLRRLFEPFYSTKAQGRGLGMAAVHGIVTHHEGSIQVTSTLGVGTRVEIILPATPPQQPTPPAPLPRPSQGQGQTILIVDDEPSMLRVISRILKHYGYHTLVATGGVDAVTRCTHHPGAIDLIVLDMGMPGMSGSEAFPLLRAQRPHAPIVICSGYELDSAIQELLAQGAAGYLSKPFLPRELLAVVQAALHTAASSQR